MTTSATVLDLIEAFPRWKTMFAAVEPGIFEGKRPTGYKELAHLLEKQQEYLNAPEPCSRNRDRQATSATVLDLIEASRGSKTMLAAVEPGILDSKRAADYKELTRLKNPPKIRVPGIRIGAIVKG